MECHDPVHRLRQRYRDRLRAAIAETVATPPSYRGGARPAKRQAFRRNAAANMASLPCTCGQK